MTYLGPKVMANFRRKTSKSKRAAAGRYGMDPAYLAVIRKLPSCVSGRRPCVPHHLRCVGERGIALKSTDRNAVPLTEDEHTWATHCVHAVGAKREAQWFNERGCEVVELAEKMWKTWEAGGRYEELLALVNGWDRGLGAAGQGGAG